MTEFWHGVTIGFLLAFGAMFVAVLMLGVWLNSLEERDAADTQREETRRYLARHVGELNKPRNFKEDGEL